MAGPFVHGLSSRAPATHLTVRFLMLRGPGLVLALSSLLAVSATPIFGQQEASLDLSDEALSRFVATHAAVTEAREQHQGELARTHDTEGKRRLREEFLAEVSRILAEHEMPEQVFTAYTAVISVDSEVRRRFEEMLAALTAGPGGTPGRETR